MLDTYHVAELAKDVSTMTEAFSNDFSNSQGATKAALQQFFQGLVDYGALDNLKINMDNAEVAIDGDTATIKGVSYTSSMGTATYVYTLQREADGIWRFVTSEVSM
jgi:ketosteroid isomerase-like protein